MTPRLPGLARIAVVVCLLSVAARTATAQTFPLTLHMSGTTGGRASVIGIGGGLCDFTGTPTQCVFQMTAGASVRMAASAPAGQTPGLLSAGTGPAAGCGFSACGFTMSAAADVNVDYGSHGPVATLTVTLAGDGRGTVSTENTRCQNVDPPQGTACGTAFLAGTPVEIQAQAGPGARFNSYSGGTNGAAGCGGTALCDFPMTANAAVTATFRAITTLAVSPAAAQKVVGQTQVFTAMGSYTDGVTEAVLPGMGAWITQTPLPTARYALAATTLNSKLYAVGGDESGAPGASFTEYDPSSLTWTPRASMPTPREGLGAVTVGGFIYAIAGDTVGSVPVATVERWDPIANSWTARAPLSAPRRFLAAAAVNGIIYAVGGETVSGGVSTASAALEAYDPATNTWTTKAPMPTARSFLAVAVVGNTLYAIGGGNGGSTSAVEAYDPATNTWTAKASMPGPLGATAAASTEGVIYVMGGSVGQFTTYAYDPVQNLWSNKLNMATGRSELAAAAINGIVYTIGGLTGATGATLTSKVESFIESLRWSSSAPAIGRITQQGNAAALSPGTTTINASIGSFGCGTSCGTFTAFASFPTDMALESPAGNATLQVNQNFTVSGWALNKGAPSGTGVDAIHVYAVPPSGPGIFLGVATYGLPRSDVAATYGAQFTNSGFTLTAGATLAAGSYTIIAYAHDALTNSFDANRSAVVLLKAAPASSPFMYIDTPGVNQIVTSAFEVGGWAIDAGAFSGTGIDAMAFYVFPNDGAGGGVYIGQGSYGWARGDVGAILGAQFTNCGYHFTITGLPPGQYVVGVYAHSTVTGAYSIVRTVHVTVNATALMSIDTPGAESAVGAQTFAVAGWSIDRNVESTALGGSGVDTLHVYAYPNPGSGQAPIFLGVATVGVSRPDVGAAYGARYATSGYELTIDRAALGLTPGVYNIVVHSHSAVSGAFNNVALVRVTLQ